MKVFSFPGNFKHSKLLFSNSTTPKIIDFPGGSDGKESAYSARDLGSILGREDLLEKEMATHSNILAWRIPGMGEPSRL